MFSSLVTLVSIVERKEFRKGIFTIHCDEHTDDDGNADDERRMKSGDDETGMMS